MMFRQKFETLVMFFGIYGSGCSCSVGDVGSGAMSIYVVFLSDVMIVVICVFDGSLVGGAGTCCAGVVSMGIFVISDVAGEGDSCSIATCGLVVVFGVSERDRLSIGRTGNSNHNDTSGILRLSVCGLSSG
jgi:hypothetical protein